MSRYHVTKAHISTLNLGHFSKFSNNIKKEKNNIKFVPRYFLVNRIVFFLQIAWFLHEKKPLTKNNFSMRT